MTILEELELCWLELTATLLRPVSQFAARQTETCANAIENREPDWFQLGMMLSAMPVVSLAICLLRVRARVMLRILKLSDPESYHAWCLRHDPGSWWRR